MNKLLNKITKGNLEEMAANANATLIREKSQSFVKEFVIDASVGIYQHERDVPQPVTITVSADANLESFGNVITINDVVNYEQFIRHAEDVASEGHINLLEDFADRMAKRCFADARIESITISLEKNASSMGAKSLGFTATYHRNI